MRSLCRQSSRLIFKSISASPSSFRPCASAAVLSSHTQQVKLRNSLSTAVTNTVPFGVMRTQLKGRQTGIKVARMMSDYPSHIKVGLDLSDESFILMRYVQKFTRR